MAALVTLGDGVKWESAAWGTKLWSVWVLCWAVPYIYQETQLALACPRHVSVDVNSVPLGHILPNISRRELFLQISADRGYIRCQVCMLSDRYHSKTGARI